MSGEERWPSTCCTLYRHFSRFVYVEPLKTKEQGEVTEAFQRIQKAPLGRLGGKGQVIPKNITTDSGAEFEGPVSGNAREVVHFSRI